MSNKDQVALAEQQVTNLIDLVMQGVDPNDLIDATVESIHEGYGNGPFPIGSKVRINKPWAGEAVGGGAASLSQGDVVWVVQTGLGETGYDRMVLFPDGTTKAIIPLNVLGEEEDEPPPNNKKNNKTNNKKNNMQTEQDIRREGPSGQEVPSAKGAPGGMIQGKNQGDAATPDDVEPDEPPKGKLLSIPSTTIGQGAPKDDPAAQPTPALTPGGTISGKTLEAVRGEVLWALDQLMDEAESTHSYRTISEIHRDLIRQDEADLYALMHYFILGEDEYPLNALADIYEKCKSKKKGMREGESFDEETIRDFIEQAQSNNKKNNKKNNQQMMQQEQDEPETTNNKGNKKNNKKNNSSEEE
jgi:hypothetical protein